MRFRKALSIAAALCMLFTTGCSGNTKAKTEVSHIPSVEDGNFLYSIVRSSEISDELNAEIKDLRSVLKKAFGSKVKTAVDTVEKETDDSYEIVIGETTRSVTEKAAQVLKDNRDNCTYDFIIKVYGRKIVIYSPNDEMLCKAVNYFNKTYCKDEKSWEKLHEKTEDLYEAPITAYDHTLGSNKLKDYTVVTPRDMEYIYGKDVYELTEHLDSTEGISIAVADERNEEKPLEILVGNLDRAESKAVSASGKNWIIKMSGDKLVIKGGDGLALSDALQAFLKMITDAESKKTGIQLAADFEQTGTYSSANGGFDLVWNDEFNQKNLDAYRWVEYAQNKYGETSKSSLGGLNYKMGTSNVKMTGDGCATLFANRKGKDFYSASMSTFDTMLMRYGIIEIRAKFPESPVNCSFWLNGALLGSSVMTEYDIIENFGKTDSFASNLHRWWGLNNKSGDSGHTSLDVKEFVDKKKFNFSDITDKGLNENFHTYTMDWDSEKIRFAVDGKVYFEYDLDEYDNPDSRMLPVYLIFSCSMGATDYGIAATEDDISYGEYKIDYVRIYQRGDNDSQLFTREQNNIPNWNNRKIEYVNYASRQ